MKRKPIPKKIRDQVIQRFDGRCGYCGQKPDKICIDHISPVAMSSYYPEAKLKDVNAIENLMPACFSCNNYKTTFKLEEFRQQIESQISRARENSLNFRLAERFGLIQVLDKPVVFYFETIKGEK